MAPERLELLFVSQVPPSPPRYGGQVRMHGLMTALARRHAVSAVALVAPDDREAAARALAAYCREVVLVPLERGHGGAGKRLLQLRSMVSPHSFERHLYRTPALQPRLDELLGRVRFDAVVVEFPYLAHLSYRRAPPGSPPPRLVLDEHNIEYDVLRQVARSEAGLDRRVYNLLNWVKLRHEERSGWRRFDAVAVSSGHDEAEVRRGAPGTRTAVVQNAVDLERFRPRAGDPAPDGRTILFFGAINYYPNTDGVLFFLREIWPALAARRPDARVEVVGPRPPPEVLALQGPRVAVTGFVEDLRPHLARAAAVVVPLRIGSGTRLKILEAMAMGKAVVSTRLGAEGLDVADGRELLLADEPEAFGQAVCGLLDDPARGATLGRAARALVEDRYSWAAAAERLEGLVREALAAPDR